MAPKLYSLNGANRMLILLKQIIRDLRKLQAESRKLIRKKLYLEAENNAERFEMATVEDEIAWTGQDEERLKNELDNLGVVLEDAVHGRVNIYSNYRGHLVFLSWEDGEEEINRWREMHYPFNHRVTISDSERMEFTDEPVEEITWEENMTAGRSGRIGK